MSSRRPQRIELPFRNTINMNKKVFAIPPQKLKSPVNKNLSKSFKVGFFDLDVNGHLNNTKYLEWILESYDLKYLKDNEIKKFEINFQLEALYGDEIAVINEEFNEHIYSHAIIRKRDDKELCVAKAKWKE